MAMRRPAPFARRVALHHAAAVLAVLLAAVMRAAGPRRPRRRGRRPVRYHRPDADPEVPRTSPNSLPAAEIRRRFLEFFEERGHTVVPSASLIPAGDQTLLFTNSGMVQFKEVFTGAETRSYTRAVDVQRCLRVAGKHNDFEEVGRTPRHHTLFEMMGNWSFGDYFKREAIHWAWEFLTKELGIPAERLAATTYPTTRSPGRSGATRSACRRSGWPAGATSTPATTRTSGGWPRPAPAGRAARSTTTAAPTSPRGRTASRTTRSTARAGSRSGTSSSWSSTSSPDGPRVPLPFPSVDTGLGLERLASVLQGVLSNYDTDLFTPIHETLRRLLGHDPEGFEAERFSYQVIADHSRAITFLVADGVLPSNEGRGYVLRRILRRAVRHGRLLGRREPFLVETAATVIDVMADAYPYLREERERVLATIAREEAQFARTLDAGTVHLEEALIPLTDAERVVGRRPEDVPARRARPRRRRRLQAARHVRLPGRPDRRAGRRVRRPRRPGRLRGRPRRAARAESRAAARRSWPATPSSSALYESILRRTGDTAFLGYETTEAEGTVVAIVRDGVDYDELTGHGEAEVILDRTPFYAEGGGQVGDRGELREAGGGSAVFAVEDTQRPTGGLVVHRGTLHGRLRVGETVSAVVDAERRARTMRNHTATHLLHRALRNVVGPSAKQAGSLVAPDYLRFDYPFDRALTDDEKRAIEDEVRRVVREDRPVTSPSCRWPRRSRTAPTRSSTRSTARRSARSGSRTTASSCAAARTAGRRGRSAASSSPATGASARGCGGSRPSPATAPTPTCASGPSSSRRPRSASARSRRTPCSTGSPRSRRSSGKRSVASARAAAAPRSPASWPPGPRRSRPACSWSWRPAPGSRSTR